MQDSPSRRPGDRIIRRARVTPVTIDVGPQPVARRRTTPTLILVYGFAILAAFGTFLLSLPIANEGSGFTSFMTAFFTATSAVTVTGLVTVDTATFWSPFGQAVILILIQLGGLGIMTFSTLIFLILGRRIGLRERLALRDTSGVAMVGGIVRLIRRIALVVIVAELLAFIAFSIRFSFDFPLPTALWHGLFHSISSFNNAGFVVLPNNGLQAFQRDASVMILTAVLIILGGISVTLLADMATKRRFNRFSLDTKLVLSLSVALWVIGTVIVFASEYTNDATLGPMGVGGKLMTAFFESVSGRTAGFEAVPIASMQQFTWLAFMALMFIGGVAGSTTGGIKVNTLGVMLAAVTSAIRGRPKVEAFRQQVPDELVSKALTVAVLGIATILIAVFVLTIVEDAPPIELLFETVSAFGTVGNSTGITSTLSTAGQFIIIFLMFSGKIGPLTLMLALARRREPSRFRYAEESVRIG